jgi:hypothetical protein
MNGEDMKPRTQKSIELYNTLLNRGFPQEFCEQISRNLNTDWTAQRMLGYLSHYRKLQMAEIVDEMLAILSDRNRIMQKHEWENTNAKPGISKRGLKNNMKEVFYELLEKI